MQEYKYEEKPRSSYDITNISQEKTIAENKGQRERDGKWRLEEQ